MKEFDAIFKEFTPLVYHFLLSLCGNESLAEELTSETFYSETFIVAAVNECTLFIMTDKGTSAQRFLLLFGQGWPERELCQCAFHINGSCACRSRGHRRCAHPRRAHGHGGHSEHWDRSPDFR